MLQSMETWTYAFGQNIMVVEACGIRELFISNRK
jgi:hypothetical protein